jgi:hypothetical protein
VKTPELSELAYVHEQRTGWTVEQGTPTAPESPQDAEEATNA